MQWVSEMVGAHLIGLALAMPHRQLGMDQGGASGHLEGSSPARGLIRHDGNLLPKLVHEERLESVRELLVASAASELDVDGKGRH